MGNIGISVKKSNTGNAISRTTPSTGSASNWIQVAPSTTLDLTSAGTIELWIKPNAYQSTYSGLVAKTTGGSGGSQVAYLLYIRDGLIQFWLGQGSAFRIVTTPFINHGQWMHITAAWGSGFQYIYVNAAERGKVAFTGNINVLDTQFLAIAGRSFATDSNTGDNFNGQIDNLRIYNVLRTPAEINSNMQTNTPASTGLVLSHNYDEVSGDYLDSSGNNNTGVFSGFLTANVITRVPSTVPIIPIERRLPISVKKGTTGNMVSYRSPNIDSSGETTYPIECGNGSSLDLTNAGTLSLWCRSYSGKEFAFSNLISKASNGVTGTGNSYGLYWDGTNKRVVGFIGSGSSFLSVNTPSARLGNWWNYISFTWGDGFMRLYINADLVSSVAFSGNANITTSILRMIGRTFGTVDGASQSNFDGDIDNAVVFNTCRNPLQIKQDMITIPVATTGLVAGYTFDEASGNFLDISGNNNTGIAVSSANTKRAASTVPLSVTEKRLIKTSNIGAYVFMPGGTVGSVSTGFLDSGVTKNVQFKPTMTVEFNVTLKKLDQFGIIPFSTSNKAAGQGGIDFAIQFTSSGISYGSSAGYLSSNNVNTLNKANGLSFHVAVVFSQADSIARVYFDGVEVGSNVYNGSSLLPDSLMRLYLGKYIGGVGSTGAAATDNSAGWDAKFSIIDEVRVWHTVRTQVEIQANINKKITSATGLAHRWGFDEESGNPLDSVGGVTLTPYSGARRTGSPFNLS